MITGTIEAYWVFQLSSKDHERWCRWNGRRTKRRLKRAAELRERARKKMKGTS